MADEETKETAEETAPEEVKDDTTDSKPTRRRTKKSTATKKEAPKAKSSEESVEEPKEALVRMTRRNPRYEVRGASGKLYAFTQAHPFQIVLEGDADGICKIEGFEMATPEQVENFYK